MEVKEKVKVEEKELPLEIEVKQREYQKILVDFVETRSNKLLTIRIKEQEISELENEVEAINTDITRITGALAVLEELKG